MKIVQLTDLHLVAPGKRLYGLDPRDRLASVLAHVATHHGDAACVVLTGDLADAGAIGAYQCLKSLLDGFALPFQLMLGNHDDRAAFRQVFGTDGLDQGGFLQAALEVQDHVLVFLDTLETGRADGSLSAGRLDWLADQLDRAANRPVILFMHHAPTHLHVPNFASIAFDDPDGLHAVVSRHSNVRHMAFGHMHLGISGTWRGIPFSVSRGLGPQIALDLQQSGKPAFVAAAPAYDILLVDADGVTVHTHAGLEDMPVIRPADPK